MTTFLWVIFPYICLTVFVVGHVWRYRYDKFGWTTRSSQLYEDRLLRIGSPLFHFGILAVFLGHVMGLGVPKSWTESVGISEDLYHFMAVSIGAIAGFATVVGMAILIYRRRTNGPVFSATTKGRSSAAWIVSARASACDADVVPASSTTNSSPASLAARSGSRMSVSMRSATDRSRSSPALWPLVSFTSFRPSTSRRSTPSGRR